MTAKESWLKSDDPEKYADAMVRCKHPGGHCGADGFCHYGDCFDDVIEVVYLVSDGRIVQSMNGQVRSPMSLEAVAELLNKLSAKRGSE